MSVANPALVSSASIDALLANLFDDASRYPPARLPLATALSEHRRHLAGPHAAYVGPFVCSEDDLEPVQALSTAPLALALAVRADPGVVPRALARVASSSTLRLAAVELPLRDASVSAVATALRGVDVAFVEVPVADVTSDVCADLAVAGLRLKLRTGAMVADGFPSEPDLAAAVVEALGAGLTFKCTAGLHNAARRRDPATGFQHHGLLNVLLAVSAALDGSDAQQVAEVLADQDAPGLADRVRTWSEHQVAAVRGRFASVGTCSIDEPLADLRVLGLLGAE